MTFETVHMTREQTQALLDKMTRDERSLLLFLETRAVDYGGRVDGRHMNGEDFEIAKRWNEQGFVFFGRIVARHCNTQGGNWCKLSASAWTLAQAERLNRAERMWLKKSWMSTADNIEKNGITSVRLGMVDGQDVPFKGDVETEDKATRT